jgi:predicted DCC family thiol-disulfide oxidoreductase YuxK
MFDVRPRFQGLLIFDGDCSFCTTSVRWVQRILPAPPATTPYQWTELESYGLTLKEAQSRVWLVTPTARFGGHHAVSAMLRYQPAAAFRFVGWLMVIPPWSWAAGTGYALIARFRDRLPGGSPACQMKR